ncbi:MAG: hypothetical protein ACTHU0_18880 [Kofleriaceae bacterium]
MRELVAIQMLGRNFDLSRLGTQLIPTHKVFTNGQDDGVATLLTAPRLSRAWLDSAETRSLLAVFPSETHVLWTPDDTPTNAALLHAMAKRARTREEDFLSDEVLRFDGVRWSSPSC